MPRAESPATKLQGAIDDEVASLDDLLDAFGREAVEEEGLSSVVQMVDRASANGEGRRALARWIERADFDGTDPVNKQLEVLRKLAAVGDEISELASIAAPDEAEEMLDRAEKRLRDVAREAARGGDYSLASDLVMATLESFSEADGPPGLPTGFGDLDELLGGGLQDGDLVVLAGRPSMGKTTLALDITRHVTLREGVGVGIFALEGSESGIMERLLCGEAGIRLQNARAGDLRAEEEREISHAAGKLKGAVVAIEDRPGLTVQEVRSRARRMVRDEGCGLLCVDYLQRARAPGAESRVQEVSSVSRGLADLAEELEVPLIAVSQLSRRPEQRGGDGRPRLSDLRGSGELEQDADVATFVYRESEYRDATDPDFDPHAAELLIRKQRDGPTGVVKLRFDFRVPSFRGVELR